MKKNILISSFFCSTWFFISCEKPLKDPKDYFPKVETVSAEMKPDGTVEITGRIIDKGNTDIEYIGFCMDTVSQPLMNVHQKLASTLNGNEFTATYAGFEIYKRYYFRAWATNYNTYAYGNEIYIDSIEPVINPPCNPTLNSFDMGSFPVNLFYQYKPTEDNGWTMTVSGGNATCNLHFNSKPLSKIYEAHNSMVGPEYVRVDFSQGFVSGVLNDGAKVYVKQTNVNSWTVTICNEPWVYQGSTLHLTTKFNCP